MLHAIDRGSEVQKLAEDDPQSPRRRIGGAYFQRVLSRSSRIHAGQASGQASRTLSVSVGRVRESYPFGWDLKRVGRKRTLMSSQPNKSACSWRERGWDGDISTV